MTTNHPMQPPAKRPSLAESATSTSAARAETALHARQWEAIFETLVDGLIVFDAHGNLLHMNAAARALLGHERQPDYSLKKATERPSPYHPRDEHGQALAIEQWPITRILQGEALRGSDAVDVRLVNQDGQELEVSVSGSPLWDEAGQLSGAVVTLHDVTERRRLARRTQESLEAVLAMAEALVTGSGDLDTLQGPPARSARTVARQLADLTCRVLGCQRIAISLLDPETDILRPLTVAGLSPQQETQWWVEQKQQVPLHASPEPMLVAQLKAGEVVQFDLTQPLYQNLPNPYGVTTMLVVPMLLEERLLGLITLDHGGPVHVYTPDEQRLAQAVAKLTALVVERERLLRERAEAEARVLALQEANQRLETFISIVSHELRTPITSIKANLQIVLRRIKQARGAADASDRLAQPLELLERMEQQMRRLTRLLNDVIDLARIRTGRLDIAPEPCNLGTLLVEIVQEEQANNPGRAIQIELPPDQVVQVVADPDRIGQVISNYLSNALKYSPADQPVQVGLALEGDQARVWVRDQGPGIPLEDQPRIWELFHRVPGIEVQSGSGVGLGLGLHISKTLIERHGGQVGLDSAPGIGSTFWFTLPLAAERRGQAE
ncbi:MAG TPA: ATP-binding protein [Ktedonobacterales bacterium]|nr:ATP-binding protein [Ktedonobacterales bacterium]